MNIIVNGTPVNTGAIVATNLEEALIHIQKTSLPINHLVGVVRVNGNEFSELYPGQARDVGIDRVRELDIKTVSLEQFSAAAVKDCAILISRITSSSLHTAELFRMYDEHEAFEQYSRLLDSIRALVHFIDAARRTLKWDFAQPMPNSESAEHEWVSLHGIIDELGRVQEEGDIILLADVLEYELVPCLNRWKGIFTHKLDSMRQ